MTAGGDPQQRAQPPGVTVKYQWHQLQNHRFHYRKDVSLDEQHKERKLRLSREVDIDERLQKLLENHIDPVRKALFLIISTTLFKAVLVQAFLGLPLVIGVAATVLLEIPSQVLRGKLLQIGLGVPRNLLPLPT